MNKSIKRWICLGLFALLCATAFSALFWGSVPLDSGAVLDSLKAFVTGREAATKNLYNLVVQVRLPRVCLTVLAGAALSIVGILMQTLTGNPLAEPYVLGVSSGASAGAAGAIVFQWFAFLPAGHGGAHGRDESVDIESLCVGCAIYAAAIAALDDLTD